MSNNTRTGFAFIDCDGVQITSSDVTNADLVDRLSNALDKGKTPILQNIKIASTTYTNLTPVCITNSVAISELTFFTYGSTNATPIYKITCTKTTKKVKYTTYNVKSAT